MAWHNAQHGWISGGTPIINTFTCISWMSWRTLRTRPVLWSLTPQKLPSLDILNAQHEMQVTSFLQQSRKKECVSGASHVPCVRWKDPIYPVRIRWMISKVPLTVFLSKGTVGTMHAPLSIKRCDVTELNIKVSDCQHKLCEMHKCPHLRKI